MTKLPFVTGERVVRALKKAGFFVHHQKGSHITMKHTKDPNKRVIVPVHGGKTLGKGLILTIINESGLTIEEFIEIL